MLPSSIAGKIVKEVRTAVDNRKDIPYMLQLNQREVNMFAPRLENPDDIDGLPQQQIHCFNICHQ